MIIVTKKRINNDPLDETANIYAKHDIGEEHFFSVTYNKFTLSENDPVIKELICVANLMHKEPRKIEHLRIDAPDYEAYIFMEEWELINC